MPAGVGTAPRCRVGQPPGKAYGFRRREPPAPAWTALQEHRHAVGQKQPGPADVGPIVSPPLPEPSRLDRAEDPLGDRLEPAGVRGPAARSPVPHLPRSKAAPGCSAQRRAFRGAARAVPELVLGKPTGQRDQTPSQRCGACRGRLLREALVCADPVGLQAQQVIREVVSRHGHIRAHVRFASHVEHCPLSAVDGGGFIARLGPAARGVVALDTDAGERHATAAHRRNSPSSAHRQPGPTVEYDGEQTGIRWSCCSPDRSRTRRACGGGDCAARVTDARRRSAISRADRSPTDRTASRAPRGAEQPEPFTARTGHRAAKVQASALGCFARRRPGAESTEGGHGGCCQPTFGRAAVFRPRGGR